MKKYIQQIIKYKAEWMSFMNESVKHIFVAIYGMFFVFMWNQSDNGKNIYQIWVLAPYPNTKSNDSTSWLQSIITEFFHLLRGKYISNLIQALHEKCTALKIFCSVDWLLSLECFLSLTMQLIKKIPILIFTKYDEKIFSIDVIYKFFHTLFTSWRKIFNTYTASWIFLCGSSRLQKFVKINGFYFHFCVNILKSFILYFLSSKKNSSYEICYSVERMVCDHFLFRLVSPES